MRFHFVSLAAALVAALSLSGCGGGGDGGSTTVFTPVFSAGVTSSSAVPLTPIAPVQATGGAQFSNMSSSTAFPAMSATLSGTTGINPSLSAPTVDLTGATMQIVYNPGSSYVVSKSLGGTTYSDTYGAGTFVIDQAHVYKELPVTGLTDAYSDFVYYLPVSAIESLDYTQFGYWSRDTASASANTIISPYVIGYVTPAGSVPAAGTAIYAGRTIGAAARSGYDGAYLIRGAVTANVNFTAGTVAASFTNVVGTNSLTGLSTAFSNFGGTANIAGNAFSGAIASTATSGTILGGSDSLTGTLNGQFFGPGAEELGGIWTLTGGGGWNAAGSFAAGQ